MVQVMPPRERSMTKLRSNIGNFHVVSRILLMWWMTRRILCVWPLLMRETTMLWGIKTGQADAMCISSSNRNKILRRMRMDTIAGRGRRRTRQMVCERKDGRKVLRRPVL